MEIKEKLFKIQQELNVPKGQYNSFGGYKFRSCEDILTAVKPLLNELKCILVLNDQLINLGDRYYIKAQARLIDVETDDEIYNIAYAREEETKKGMDGSQITGASSSYARKYALNGLFGIDDVKDSDSTNVGEITTEKEALEYKLTFGKYNGKTLKEISETNDSYMYWLVENGDETIKKACELLGYSQKTEEDVKNMPIQESQKNRIKDEVDTETIKMYLKTVGKSKLSELTYFEAEELLK
jgi:hypothetical protein